MLPEQCAAGALYDPRLQSSCEKVCNMQLYTDVFRFCGGCGAPRELSAHILGTPVKILTASASIITFKPYSMI